MMKRVTVFVLVLFLLISQISTVAAQGPVVRAILFYSPTCPYCHTVITEVLPPLFQIYGGQPEVLYIPPTPEEEAVGSPLVGIFGESLEILYVNTYTQLGQELYQAAVEVYSIPPELQAVPMLIVADTVLIGGTDIPTQLPGIIEEGIASGGIDWASLPGLTEAIGQLIPAPTALPPTEVSTQEVQESAEPSASLLVTEVSILDRIKLDPAGNVLAILVLIGMVISVAMVSSRLVLPDEIGEKQGVSWLIPVLCVIGIGVAAYLTYVEASGTKAVCGPVGDCNTVQESEYAFLFGIIPVGALGLAGYVAIILAWLLARFGDEPWIQWSKVALLGMSLFGTLFSIYLTFLEPFVIGATCAWCVTSAVIITILMWLTVGPASEAISQLRGIEEI
ncbi:MAG: hypothetical protein A2Z14_19545 [Chloroflexi bacterium RBG_16_48_8]|nr:MAG: hypothetical protein A2Z14_19545 [Chloroflexi bacterium RBG_16_48_8]